MMVRQHSDPTLFLQRAGSCLESREAENTLMLGTSSWLATHPERIKQAPYFVTVEEDGKIEAVAMMTPPHNMVLSRACRDALAAIVEHASGRDMILPGVNGPAQTSQLFAEMWARRTGGSFQLRRSLRIYELLHVIPPRSVSGHFRLASQGDADMLARWLKSFGVDIGEPLGEEEVLESIRYMLSDKRLYVWEDRGLRSMAVWAGPTPHGVRISAVFTPPEFRGRGYASACVAAASKVMLDSGKRFCCLFTDLSNPTSNRIYQRMGYRSVCDFAEYKFTSTGR